MTPEEVLNQQIWEILQRIREEILATADKKHVKYRFSNIEGVGIIPPERKRKILYKLEGLKAFTIQKNKDGVRIGDGNTFYLNINALKFDQIYSEYKKINSTQQDQTSAPPANIVSSMTPNIIIADLTALYSRIENEPDLHMFYLKIAVYGKYLVDHPQINPLLSELYEESKTDSQSIIDDRQNFFNLWLPLAQKLLKLAEKENVKGNPNILFQDLAALKQKVSEPMISLWKSDIDGYYYAYRNVIQTFVQEGKSSQVYALDIHADSIGLELNHRYDAAKRSWDLYEKLREIKPWWAHYQIMRLVGGVLKLKSLRKYFDEDDIVDSLYQYEFEQVRAGGTFVFLNKKKFSEWIKILHEYIIPRIKATEKINVKTETLISITKQTKHEKEREIRKLIKIASLGKKETALLTNLFDFEPHETKEIEKQTLTKDLPHLKEALNQKLRKHGYLIETKFGGGFGKSYYTLRQLSNVN